MIKSNWVAETVEQKALWFALKNSHVPYYLLEDAKQEAQLGLVKAMREYDDGRAALGTYLELKAAFQVKDFLRSWDHSRVKDKPKQVSLKKYKPTVEPTQTQTVLIKEVHALIRSNLLTELERNVIEGFFFEELLVREIALKLNLSTRVIFKVKASALVKLREEIR